MSFWEFLFFFFISILGIFGITLFLSKGDFIDDCEIFCLVILTIMSIVIVRSYIVFSIQYLRSFRYALKSGKLAQRAKKLLKRGNLNKKDSEGVTILYVAAQEGDCELVQWLVEHGANVNEKTIDGYTYSYVKNKINRSEQKGGDTALYRAVKSGNWDIAKYLIEHGADIQEVLNSAIQYKYSNLERIKWLVENGADIQETLNSAAKYERWELVQWLVNQGADIHKNEESILDYAAQSGNLEMVQWLVKQGVDVHKNEECALHSAAICNKWEVVKYLVKKGADINSKDNGENNTILHIAINNMSKEINMALSKSSTLVEAANKYSLELIQWLVMHRADVNAKNKNGYTPLHFAAKNGMWNLLSYLIEQGADINAKSKYGKTVLQLVKKNNNKIVQWLKELGAKE